MPTWLPLLSLVLPLPPLSIHPLIHLATHPLSCKSVYLPACRPSIHLPLIAQPVSSEAVQGGGTGSHFTGEDGFVHRHYRSPFLPMWGTMPDCCWWVLTPLTAYLSLS